MFTLKARLKKILLNGGTQKWVRLWMQSKTLRQLLLHSMPMPRRSMLISRQVSQQPRTSLTLLQFRNSLRWSGTPAKNSLVSLAIPRRLWTMFRRPWRIPLRSRFLLWRACARPSQTSKSNSDKHCPPLGGLLFLF